MKDLYKKYFVAKWNSYVKIFNKIEKKKKILEETLERYPDIKHWNKILVELLKI